MSVKTSHYKIVLFGVKKDTYDLYKRFKNHIDLVITLDDDEMKNYHISGGEKINKLIDKECYESNSYKFSTQECKIFFNNNSFDLGIVYGWQRIIPEYVLDRFRQGVFGFHASPLGLPFGKGRSPLNWSMILNFKQVYNHCFKYNKNVDDGSIYSTTKLDILPWDNINSLREKSIIDAEKKIDNLIIDFHANQIKLQNQDATKPESFFPKRTIKDGEIDLSKSTNEIYNLVRGVSHPFPGAFLSFQDNKKITIWDAHPFTYSLFTEKKYKSGEILKIFNNNSFLLKTIDGVLLIKDYSSENIIIKVGNNLNDIC
jgi:methionyl-tRNA formyltransferase